jgi:hypothetical protein
VPARHPLSPRPRLVGTGATLFALTCCVPPAPTGSAAAPLAPTPTLAATPSAHAAADAADATGEAPHAANVDASARSGAAEMGGASAGADAAAATPAPPASPAPSVAFERPFLAWARPRPKGEVAAGSHDEALGRWNLGGSAEPGHVSSRASFHPGTRVKVDVRVVSGRLPNTAPVNRRTGKHVVVLSQTSLLARSRKHGYWPFRLCYERHVQTHGKTDGGATTIGFRVERSGRPSQARLVSTRLHAPDIARCLVEKVNDLELLPPPRRTGVELTVQLWPGDAPLPTLPPPPPNASDPSAFDARSMQEVLEANRPAIAECYAQGLARDPGLWGRVQVHVEVDTKGRVTHARQVESRFPDEAVVRCVLDTLKQSEWTAKAGRTPRFEVAVRLGQEPKRPAEQQ